MSLVVPAAFCPHPDEYLKLAVDNSDGVHRAIVFCDLCTHSWPGDRLTGELLDRCLRFFESARWRG